MKTNKFENTIRQKLESISPDFKEDNWISMQKYMNAQAPPSFWHKYSNQLGYAAAASVVLISTFLYANQVQKSKQLITDVENLKSQVQMLSEQPRIMAMDTVYVLSKSDPVLVKIGNAQNLFKEQKINTFTENAISSNNSSWAGSKNQIEYSQTTIIPENKDSKIISSVQNNAFANQGNIASTEFRTHLVEVQSLIINHSALSSLAPVNRKSYPFYSAESDHKLKEMLFSKLSKKQFERDFTLLENDNKQSVHLASLTPMAEYKINATKITKPDNTVPVLPIKSSYRFGVSYQAETRNQIKSVITEIPISKKFSFSTGLSWLTAKPIEFFNEKIFKEKNKKDFDEMRSLDDYTTQEIVNIKVKTSAVQIPLTLAFRNSINENLDYYVNTGTNITVSSKDKFNYNITTTAPLQNSEYHQDGFEQRQVLPLINSWNVGVGIEKSWQPIVIQLEAYLVNYFTPLTCESSKVSPGLKVKMLYQFGKKLNNSIDFKTSDKI